MAKNLPWIKIYTELRHDLKLRRCCPAEKWLWIVLLILAGESSERGKIFLTPNKGLSESDIADAAGLSPMEDDYSCVEPALKYFQSVGMIKIESNGTIEICHFVDRQYDNPSDHPAAVAERVRKHRNAMKRQCNERDTDTDLDLDSDIDKEKGKNLGEDKPLPTGCGWCLRPKENESDDYNLILFHHREYKQRFGECYDSSKAIAGWRKHFKRILELHPKATVEKVIIHALDSPADWVHGLNGIVKHFDEILLKQKAKEPYGELRRNTASDSRRANPSDASKFSKDGHASWE